MASETKEFPTLALVSLTSGVMVCASFSVVHEAAEFLMGHPIWTHHFASKELWTAMRERVIAQHPDLPTDLSDVTKENWREKAAEIEERFGATLTISQGDGATAMHPLDGIPEGKPVVVVSPATPVQGE